MPPFASTVPASSARAITEKSVVPPPNPRRRSARPSRAAPRSAPRTDGLVLEHDLVESRDRERRAHPRQGALVVLRVVSTQ